MKANGITCLDTWVDGDGALMLVLDCTADEALSMDTLTIDVTTDDGDLAERYVNFIKTCASVDAQTKRVTLRCAAATGDVAQTITQVVAKIGEVTQAAEAAGAAATEAKQTADEAKGIAQQGGTEPAIASFVSLALPMIAPTVKDSAIAPMLKYAGEYVPEGHGYKKGEVFKYTDGTYWRVSQDITTQAQWTPGSAGLDALFYQIKLAADGIIVWAQPKGEFDAPDAGDLRHYPDENGPIYRSLVNDNAYSPDVVPGNWELAEEAA